MRIRTDGREDYDILKISERADHVVRGLANSINSLNYDEVKGVPSSVCSKRQQTHHPQDGRQGSGK